MVDVGSASTYGKGYCCRDQNSQIELVVLLGGQARIFNKILKDNFMTKTDYRYWNSILDEGKPKRRKTKVSDLRAELRGPSQNRFGGHQTQRIKPLRGSTFGPANEGRSLSAEEIAKQEERLRELGLL